MLLAIFLTFSIELEVCKKFSDNGIEKFYPAGTETSSSEHILVVLLKIKQNTYDILLQLLS